MKNKVVVFHEHKAEVLTNPEPSDYAHHASYLINPDTSEVKHLSPYLWTRDGSRVVAVSKAVAERRENVLHSSVPIRQKMRIRLPVWHYALLVLLSGLVSYGVHFIK